MKFGLLGRKLSHSYSPQIHKALGTWPYELCEREPDELASFFEDGNFTAINVTIPYKKDVIPFCSHLSDRARVLGAVNTIIRNKDGSYTGHNTDFFGFETMVRSSGLQVHGKKVLVLGSGGASNTAVHVLREMGANVIVISRSGENNYQNLHLHADAAVIVNCTPVGMYPHNGSAPVDLDRFPHLEGVLDMIYNPCRTKLLMDAQKRGLITEDGLLMLVAQAKESAEWFTGQTISDDAIAPIHSALRRQMENIVLIGMPGSGKSTVGRILSERLGRTFVDADTELELQFERTIPEIIRTDGEAAFRSMETRILEDLGKRSGLVISTGGGCVTKPKNYPLLHQNGTVFCLNRDLSLLPTDGRPLSQATNLQKMYEVREPLYAAFSDYQIDNNRPCEETAGEILSIWEEQP